MENTLQILQTIGICVSAIALTTIAFFIFTLWISFFPLQTIEDDESDLFPDEEERDGESSSRKRRRSPRWR